MSKDIDCFYEIYFINHICRWEVVYSIETSERFFDRCSQKCSLLHLLFILFKLSYGGTTTFQTRLDHQFNGNNVHQLSTYSLKLLRSSFRNISKRNHTMRWPFDFNSINVKTITGFVKGLNIGGYTRKNMKDGPIYTE